MGNNEVISRARGDVSGLCKDGGLWEYWDGWICENCGATGDWNTPEADEHDVPIKKYDSDPAAWNEEMFTWIEGEGLANLFGAHIIRVMGGSFMKDGLTGALYKAMKSTPAQKAEALVRAIKERRK